MAPSNVLLKSAKAYLDSISTIDPDALAAVTADSFYVTMGPKSTGFSTDDGVSVTRDALVERFRGLKAILLATNIDIKQEWPPNEATNQVTFWATANAEFKPEIVGDDDKEEWVWRPETIFIFTMDESGEKVKHLLEFQDTEAMKAMNVLMGKAMARLGQGM
jgi:hypothetical protein